MSFSLIDFIVDLMWGSSEVYLARRKARQAGERGEAVDQKRDEAVDRMDRQDLDPADKDRRAALSEELAEREKIERLIGNKTV